MARPRRAATLPAGTTIAVRLNESLSSERGIAGDRTIHLSTSHGELDLLSEATDVHRHGRGISVAVAPDLAKDLLPLEGVTRVSHQEHEQFQLAGGEDDRLAGATGDAADHVDLQIAVGQRRRCAGDRAGQRA